MDPSMELERQQTAPTSLPPLPITVELHRDRSKMCYNAVMPDPAIKNCRFCSMPCLSRRRDLQISY